MSFKLFARRRFMPLFVTQFFGAFNDNCLKNAMLILITYSLAVQPGESGAMSQIAAAVFIVPYFLFSALAGQLADKYDRAKLVRLVKIWEVILMVLAIPILLSGNFILLLVLLFLMGTQSTFFAPMKYSLLPQQLHEDELVAGNAFIQAGTQFAILAGIVTGGLLIMSGHGNMKTGVLLAILAVLGYFASRWILTAPGPAPELTIKWNIITETYKIITLVHKQTVVWRCILGISCFWLVGAVYLGQLPSFCKEVLNADNTVVTFFIMTFSIGIATGSLLCNKLMRGVIETTYIPAGALGMAVFTLALFLTAYNFSAAEGAARGIKSFIYDWQFWKLTVDMLLIAIFGGIFTVPLNAMIQSIGDKHEMARIIATNSIMNALFMAGGAFLVAAASWIFKISASMVFLWIAIFNFIVAIYVCSLLPDHLLRGIFRFVLTILFRVKVEGLENFSKAGSRVMVIANHTSLLDGILIAAFMPEKLTFAINTEITKKWWMKPILLVINAYPIDPANPLGTRSLINELKRDTKIMIFPEGRISVTGSLMKIYEGAGMIADKSKAMILPIRIEGTQYSIFSYMRNKVRTQWFPQITLTVMPSRRFELPNSYTGRKRRCKVSDRIYDVMAEMLFASTKIDKHIFRGVLDAAKINGGSFLIAEDAERKPLSMRKLINKSYILGRLMKKSAPNEKHVGLMLPTSLAGVVSFYACQAYDMAPAMINFTSGFQAVLSCCRTAEIKVIFTSRKFIKLAKLEEIATVLTGAGVRLIYLEDLTVGNYGAKALGLLFALLRIKPSNKATEPAVVLFTSGSEGMPKAVVLSHRNLQANRAQILSQVSFNRNDRIFNCLPIFHSFGLGVGTVLPILSGIRTFYYPSPLHYRIIPELCYDSNATIIFGTDTFMYGYARAGHPYDFFNMRIVLAGAEKIRPQNRMLWVEKFGVRLLSGYGTTEASPVISLDTPMYNRVGTVGRAVPGLECRLETVAGVREGGRLFIRGANVMLGYYLPENPGVLVEPPDGWYDTGDIVSIDEDGFITVIGRAKRFAKIGGEMVSLTAVEDCLEKLWPDTKQGVVISEHNTKGEQLVLITERKNPKVQDVGTFFRANGISELWIPKQIISLSQVPLLGSGKFDYIEAKKLVNGS